MFVAIPPLLLGYSEVLWPSQYLAAMKSMEFYCKSFFLFFFFLEVGSKVPLSNAKHKAYAYSD
jgi:hypothetical protein